MIGAIIIGIVAGYIGRALMPGKHEFGFIMTTILGIVGAILGYLLFTELLGIGDTDTFDLGSLPGAVIGVLILLFRYDRFTRRPATPAGSPGPQ